MLCILFLCKPRCSFPPVRNKNGSSAHKNWICGIKLFSYIRKCTQLNTKISNFMTIYVHQSLMPFKAFAFVLLHRKTSSAHQFTVYIPELLYRSLLITIDYLWYVRATGKSLAHIECVTNNEQGHLSDCHHS